MIAITWPMDSDNMTEFLWFFILFSEFACEFCWERGNGKNNLCLVDEAKRIDFAVIELLGFIYYQFFFYFFKKFSKSENL